MPKDVIGSAYVRIVAMSQDFEKQVQAAFDRLKPMAGKSGEEAGKAWNDGFEKDFGSRLSDAHDRIQQDLRDSWDRAGTDHGKDYGDAFGSESGTTIDESHAATVDRMGESWSSAGTEHGRAYGDPFSVEVDRAMGRSVDNSTNLWRGSNLMRFPLEAIEKLADDMPNIFGNGADNSGRTIRQRLSGHFANIGADLQALMSNIGAGLSATLSDVFKKAGGGGGNSKIFDWMTRGADDARGALVTLITLGETLGSALVGLVAALANVASGLFAIVSAAGAAAPALAVIPGLIAAIAQAGLTLLVGFKGVGQAISAGMKEAAASTGTASARARELATAQRAVESASRSLQSAEKASANAKKDLADAQKGLNDAYKEGAKQLRDIQYAAEDAALQEERSAINLANARDELARVKATNPADSRAVQEAELAYKEADLAYREARSRNKDASDEANDATKKGVKGTQAVTSAQDRLTRAQENVIASNQRVADSQRALADAQQRLADVQSGATGTAAAYTKALEKFGPQGQRFIKTVVGMRGSFKGLREAAGESIFAALTDELNKLVSGPFFGILQKNFKATGDVIASFVRQFSGMVQESANLKSIDRIMQSNTIVLGSFGDAATDLGQAFISITDAARPMTQEFAKWVGSLTAGWAATLKADNASGLLTKKFEKASGVAKQLGRIIGNVSRAIFNTGKAARDGGQTILDATEKASKKWEEWTKSIGGQKQLKDFFDKVAKGFVPLMEGINAVVKAVLLLGGNTNTVVAVAAGLKAVANVIGPIGKQVDLAAPLFKDFANSVGDIFNVLQQSGSLQGFATVLTIVAKAIAGALNWLIAFKPFGEGEGLLQKIFNGKNIVFFVGAILGVVRALSLLHKGFSFLFRGTIGKSIMTLTSAFKGLKNIFSGKSMFDGTTKSSEEARKEFIKQMKVDKLKKQAMVGVGEGAEIAAKHHMEVTDESKDTRAEFTKQMKTDKLKKAAMEDVGKAGKHAAAGIEASTKASKKDRAKAVLSRITGRSSTPTGDHERTPSRGRRVAGRVGKGLAIGGAALGGVGLAVGALAAVATLNKDSAAALGKQISDMAKNLPVALSALAAQIPTILNSIAGAIGPLIKTIAAALPGVIQSIIKALPTVLNAIMAALPKVFDAVVKVIPVIFGALTKLIPVLIQMITAALPKIINVLVGVVTIIIKALAKALPVVIKALAKALPLIIKAIVGAIPLIIKAIVTALPLVIKAVTESLPLIIGAIVEAIPAIIDAIVQAIPLIIQAVAEALPAIWEALKELLPMFQKIFADVVPKVIEGLGKLVSAIGSWVTENGPKILAKLGEWTLQFVAWVGDLLAKLPGELLKVIGAIISWIATNGPGILAKLATWTAQFIVWIGKLIIKIPIELGKLWLKIAGWVAGIALKIPGAVAGWITAFLGWVGDVVSKIPGKLAEIWTSISTWISKLPSKIATAASGMWNGFGSAFKDALNWIISLWNDFGFELKVPDEVPLIGGRGISFSTPDIPKLAAGGTVRAQSGGVLAKIAEAGRNEVVKPLDKLGRTASDRSILTLLEAQGKQLAILVAALTATSNGRPSPRATDTAATAATAAVVATQRTLSTQGAQPGAAAPELVAAIDHLTASVDSLQRPLIGGDLNVTSAPGEQAAISVPAALRRRAYTRPGAR